MSQIEGKFLQGKVAVITGAGRGIGCAIALAYARAGAAVVCSARREADIQETAALIQAAGGRAIAHVADVADYASVSVLFCRAEEAFGGVDIVVGSAGVALGQGKIADSDPALWRKTIDVNLIGAYHTAHAAIPYLRRRGGGKIIMIGSGHRKRPRPNSSAYSCSKSGLWMLIESLAVELEEDNISVNELIPGPVKTDLTSGLALIPNEWVKEPEDVAPLALFLASLPDRGPSAQSFSLMRRA
ncbi:SDR family NAD(P)-dependent oxidoreductase [Cupriavidus sp. WKF15]|uniref:SDR family NAD(P)-dependent oxidoreductase n=1 Tax=Cupriavidus sp. WKF15 TaxID=3032282 RepID=UPI0023E24B53|nr:SDR family NAD(P)-dependent oxidoreductase [Cupriavidus sp. WKF15]WER46598.1 SDR family NAD(P)-dependent oxidoreductase [Cupriavidus sp. WKF15]